MASITCLQGPYLVKQKTILTRFGSKLYSWNNWWKHETYFLVHRLHGVLCFNADDIHVRVYEERMDLLRACIVGAAGTPYHDNLFFFDPSYIISFFFLVESMSVWPCCTCVLDYVTSCLLLMSSTYWSFFKLIILL